MKNSSEIVEQQVTRLQFIDGLRGLAVFLVTVFHAAIWSGVPFGSPFTKLLSLGRVGVDLFLVLSGFCLFWPLLKNYDGKIKELKVSEYLKKRTRRIFPPYLVALVLVTICSYLTYKFGGPSWWNQPFQVLFPWNGTLSYLDLVTHLLLLHGFFKSYAHSFDGAFWSLSLEWQFYFLLIPLVWIARKWGVLLAIVIPIVVTLIFRATAKLIDPSFLKSHVGNEFSLSRWVEFAAGMLAAVVTSQLKIGWVLKLKILGNAWYVLFSTGIALVGEYVRSGYFLMPFIWGNACFTIILYAMPFIWGNACFAIILYAAQSQNHLHKFLEWKPLVALGTISYSLYLIHGSVFMVMALLISNIGIPVQTRQFIFLAIGPVIAILCSYVFFNLFEKPFLNTKPVKKEEPQLIQPSVVAIQDQALP